MKEIIAMRILVTTGDFKNFLVPNFYTLLCELQKSIELLIWHEPGNINDILTKIDGSVDFILINEYGELNSPAISGLDAISIPYAILLYDLHYNRDFRKRDIIKKDVTIIFSHYRDKFYEWYPELWKKMQWFPHHVNTELYKDYKLHKDIDLLLMGEIIPWIYPLRTRMLEVMRDKPGFVYHEHPGWHNFTEEEKSTLFVGEKYAREINRAKIFLTCDSIYKYPVVKYFEVLACNTLLLASTSKELFDLGFIPGVHFVPVDEDDFEEKAQYYLEHESERFKIAQQGYEMVREKHSTVKRAADFLNIIKDILP